MRAGLPQREPEMLKEFEQRGIYKKLMMKNEGKPNYTLHDGPPYANGNIHMGTALNKVLKDIIIRHKNMSGFKAPYVPGWDTHGLPIELKALKKDGVNPATISAVELRKLCREFAESFIDTMTDQFKRLGVIGDFEDPYKRSNRPLKRNRLKFLARWRRKGIFIKDSNRFTGVHECGHRACGSGD
jgi:isoleucyl-tRNA synthetase